MDDIPKVSVLVSLLRKSGGWYVDADSQRDPRHRLTEHIFQISAGRIWVSAVWRSFDRKRGTK